MCRETQQSRFRGYFSVDAALALVIVVFAYASFAYLASHAGASADEESRQISNSLVSLRFSSFLAEEAITKGTEGHSSVNELDLSRLLDLDLKGMLKEMAKSYAKVSVGGREGEIFSKWEGEAGEEVFCSARLALLNGEIVRLEACLG